MVPFLTKKVRFNDTYKKIISEIYSINITGLDYLCNGSIHRRCGN